MKQYQFLISRMKKRAVAWRKKSFKKESTMFAPGTGIAALILFFISKKREDRQRQKLKNCTFNYVPDEPTIRLFQS